jgi:hypothetical protein
MATLDGPQWQEHMSMRKKLGGLIAENRSLYPLPKGVSGASNGNPGSLAQQPTLSDKNTWLKEKIESTEVSNAIGRGEKSPTANRFG